MTQPIAVIGAGIIGLTSGIRLLEAGYAVTIFARDIKTNMASRAAPALWIPYKAAPEHCIMRWARKSFRVYKDFAASQGVITIPLVEFYNEDRGYPLWSKILKFHHEFEPADLPESYVRGFETLTYRIDTSIFVDYLQSYFQALGGKLVQTEFSQLTNVDPGFNLIINCSGVWSCRLVPDKKSFPIRGQYILVEKPVGLDKITFATLDEENYTLIVPRTNDCYIGGTTNYHNWEAAVEPKMIALQMQRAIAFEPRLKNCKILSTAVGFRPGRRAVRLEAEQLDDARTVIHNYGHGGAGFTVGWGCADDVVALCKRVP
jgi:D-amino-acid oxidase